MRARMSVVALLAMIPGCLIDVPAPEDGTFACETSEDCAKDWECKDGFCVDLSAPAAAKCGNNRRDEGEECDGSDVGGLSCASLNLGGGDLACNANCTFNTSGCSSTQECNNGEVEGTEACDGNSFAQNNNCVDKGFEGGTPTCLFNCTEVDYSTCEPCVSCGADACVANGPAYLCAATCTGPLDCGANAFCVPALDFKGNTTSVCKACNDGAGCDTVWEHCEWVNPGSTTFTDADVQCAPHWFDLAGSATNSGIADAGAVNSLVPDIAIVKSDDALKAGNVLVAWQEGDATGSRDILLRIFNDGLWGDLAGSGNTVGLSKTSTAANPALVLRPDGRPVVAWEDDYSVVFLKELDHTIAWSELDGSASTGVSTESGAQPFGPDLLAVGGEVWVTWGQTNSQTGSFAFRRWTSTRWETPLVTNSSPDTIVPPAAANAAGEGVFFTFVNSTNFQVNKFISPNFYVESNVPMATGQAAVDAPALAAQDNNVIAVWRDSTSGEVRYRTSSDRGENFGGDGIIADGVAPGEVAAAFSAGGVPIVAWVAETTYRSVRVVRLDGTQWVGLSGSRADGISVSDLDASHPAIAVGPNPHDPHSGVDVVCVAWSQMTGGTSGSGIYVRCHPIGF